MPDYRNTPRVCEQCGEPFMAVAAEVNRGNARYCGNACRNLAHRQPMPDRFWVKVRRGDGCWIWIGAKITDGYGHFRYQGGLILAHRLAYILTYGEIADDILVCHTCDNPSCVRPDHLFLGDHADNTRDMVSKGRGANATGHYARRSA